MNARSAALAPDLTACDREAIHIVGSVQPHGVLLALHGPDLRIVQASKNAENAFGGPVGILFGRSLSDAVPQVAATLGPDLARRADRGGEGEGAVFLRAVTLDTPAGQRGFEAAAHRSDDLIVLELEEAAPGQDGTENLDSLYPRLRAFVQALQEGTTVEALCGQAAAEVRQITGFDRVLVYRFDPGWSGTVVAEDRNDVLPSYLGLRFPASDIPAQARELYRSNRLRIIPDAGYAPVPIEPALSPSGRPLDLSQSVLRSVSPVHIEYMRNMGTMASMSVSILLEGKLWGLISCHNRTPRRVPLQVRNACDLLTRMFALQLAARERASEAEHRMRLGAIQSRLLAHMAVEDRFADGLLKNPDDVLSLADASGAAFVTGEECRLLGATPSEGQVRRLHEWLATRHAGEDVFATDALPEVFPGAEAFGGTASGLLAISISRRYASHVLWFRPEVVQTVRWGGDPTKPATPDPAGGPARLHPRRSFEIWKETVRGRSRPWSRVEVDAAADLRNAVLGIVLRRAEELAALSEELQRSNKELEAFSYSVSHDLRAPFRHIVGYSELLRTQEGDRLTDKGRRYVETIMESAYAAGTLVDSLLSFSQMGRNSLNPITIDMNGLVEEVRRRAMRDVGSGRRIEWRVQTLPKAYADPVMLRLVVENLLSNAVKYTRGRPEAVIEVGSGRDGDGDGENVYYVRDNGVGFDMAYVNKLFGVFQRLHRAEEFEGTGIGLANVRRIVERHGGRTWAEAELDRGATFFFTLPTRRQEAR
jgi:light-regulated signal transduction histidine kinase (bacteriophytochrome)